MAIRPERIGELSGGLGAILKPSGNRGFGPVPLGLLDSLSFGAARGWHDGDNGDG